MNVIAIIYEFHHQVLLSGLPSRTIGCHSLNGVGSGRCPLSCYTTCVTIHITNSMMHDVFLLSLEICENWLELNPDKKKFRRGHPSQGRLPALTPQEEAPRPRLAMSASLYSLRHVASSHLCKSRMAKNWSQLENPELAINNLEPLGEA